MQADMPPIVWEEAVYWLCEHIILALLGTVSAPRVFTNTSRSHAVLHTNQQRQCTLEERMYESTRVVDRLTRDKAWARGDPPPQGKVSSRFLAMEMDLEGGSSTSALSPQKGIRETWSLLV